MEPIVQYPKLWIQEQANRGENEKNRIKAWHTGHIYASRTGDHTMDFS